MSSATQTISPGFGERLREERKRLRMSQTQLAEAAGILRLAQARYESETSAPNTRYLAAVAAKGVNLNYLLFGTSTMTQPDIPPALQKEIEQKVFQMVEEHAKRAAGGKLSAETRFVLFELWRNELIAKAVTDASTRQVVAGGSQ